MKTLLSMALFLMMGAGAFAGKGWHVTIINQTPSRVGIYPAGSDEWHLYDFGNTQTLEPYESKTFYTEMVHLRPSTMGIAAIVGINICYGGSFEHVEMWADDHSYSVTKNISSVYSLIDNDGSGTLAELFIGTTSDYISTSISDPINAATISATLIIQDSPANLFAAAAHAAAHTHKLVMVSNTTWHVWTTGSGFRSGVSKGSHSSYDLGISGAPLLGDMDGDGNADPVVVDSSGNWYIWNSTDGYQMSGPYDLGVYGTPLVADFDGDGLADPAVYAHHTSGMLWYKWLSGNNYQAHAVMAFGEFGAQPVVGDIDGDGKVDYATVDESGNWLVMLSSLHYAIAGYYALGVAGKPLLADFDADGKADPVVVSSDGWYIWPSASGYVRNGPHVLSVP